MPPAPLAASTVARASSKTPALAILAATNLLGASTRTRSFLATAHHRPRPLSTHTMAVKPAFAPHAASPGRNGVAGKFAGWRRGLSFSSRRHRSFSISSVPSFASSSSSQSDDASEGPPPVRNISRNTSRRAGSTTSGGRSKLSSSRAQAAVALLPSYLIDARAVTQYSPSAPEGALQLSVAENQLSERPVKGLVGIAEDARAGGAGTVKEGAPKNTEMRLVDVLSQLASSTAARPSDNAANATNAFETDMIYYQPTQGVPGCRNAVAEYLQRLLATPRPFRPDNLVLGAGCNAVLENLCTVLCDPGDAVMIPTPYYAAFEFDLAARAGCHIVPVNTLDHHDEPVPPCGAPIAAEYYYPNRASLELAHERAMEETGRAPRALLLSHPNNPLGVCYPPAVVQECVDWCREREVHLISDEIYAGSVYRKRNDRGGKTFVSAMALGSGHDATEGLGIGPYVHLVYALSKDFALSGLRVGVAYTENEEILLPFQKLNDLCQISSQTQLLVERMVAADAVVDDGVENDASQKFTDVYLQANQDNIRERCDALQSCLAELGIPHLHADSGLFVWMDFREFLPALPAGLTEATESLESKERRERQLYLSLMKEHGLLFTPGMSMRNERAGFFRCVFTAASEAEFDLGLDRLRKFVGEMRS